MASNFVEFYLQLEDMRTGLSLNDDAGLFTVLEAGVPVEETVYSDGRGTSLSLPATMTDGIIQFWIDSATTSVDLSVMTEGGRAFFLEGVNISQHKIKVDPYQHNYTLVGAFAVLSAHPDGTVSGVKAPVSGGPPAGIAINRVYFHKTKLGAGVGASLVVDFGVSGDPDGFVDAATASATGYDFSNALFTSLTTDVAGATDFIALTQQRGALMQNHSGGLLTATTGGAKGYFAEKTYMISLVTTTNNLVFAINGTSALTTVAGARGYVYYEYSLLPSAGN